MARLSSPEIAPAVVWATPSVRDAARSAIRFPLAEPLLPLPAGTRTLIVVGGGRLIDAAKVFRHESAPGVRLVAVPSIWGSGAEASPVAITNGGGGRKVIRMDAAYLPDARAVWPELADSLPEPLARQACGDAWAHVLEGFHSPLASEELQVEAAALMGRILSLPLTRDARWFEAGAQACSIQARSSVGLVHGIAHTLEGPLAAEDPGFGWGHARLCATFLLPVMALNEAIAGRAAAALARHQVAPARIAEVTRALFEEEAFRRALPALEALWGEVLRDPCTRTNSTLVRSAHLGHFLEGRFS